MELVSEPISVLVSLRGQSERVLQWDCGIMASFDGGKDVNGKGGHREEKATEERREGKEGPHTN